MRTPRLHLLRNGILGLTLSTAAACGSSSPAAPEGAPKYDLSIEMTRIFVVGDCETAPGNAGEFAWRVQGSVEVPLAAFDSYETPGFPSEAGAQTYSEDDGPVLLNGVSLLLSGITEEAVARTFLTFSVIEWDQGSHDAEMRFRQVRVVVPFSLSPGVNAVDVGERNACKLSFEFRRTWTES